MKRALTIMLMALVTMTCYGQSNQDTLITIESSIIRSMYKDAVKYDSCKAEVVLLNKMIGKNERVIKFQDSVINHKIGQIESCEVSRTEISEERDEVEQERLEAVQRIERKNKAISRLLIAVGIESIVIILLVL